LDGTPHIDAESAITAARNALQAGTSKKLGHAVDQREA
jgi:hypothetical protein